MKRFRFNIASLLSVILVLGVGFAALIEATDLWDSGVFSLTLGVLLISILVVIHRAEKRRAFWLGFALFGWIYLGLSLDPTIETRFITTRGLAYLGSKAPRATLTGLAIIDYDNDGRTDLFVTNNSLPNALYANKGNGTFEDVTSSAGTNLASFLKRLAGASGNNEGFIRIGHSLLALIAAFLGRLLSHHLYVKNRRPVYV